MCSIEKMSSINKVVRQVTLLRGRLNTNIPSKCLSRKFGDDKDTGNKDNNELYQFCSCCNYPCGNEPCTSIYDDRKYGHCLPGYNRKPDFETLPNIPTDIFRCTTGEKLGPQGQASKCGFYQNLEYFSFHHMTYYDMHLNLGSYRHVKMKTGRKPP